VRSADVDERAEKVRPDAEHCGLRDQAAFAFVGTDRIDGRTQLPGDLRRHAPGDHAK
jgi:hypothetical protein